MSNIDLSPFFCIKKGVPITTAARLLGHASINVGYSHYLNVNMDDLRVAVEV